MSKRRQLALATTGLAVALSRLCVAQSPPPVGAAIDLPALSSQIRGAMREQHLPGLSLAVVVHDQLVWSVGFGVADLESGMRATGSTIYRIGSVSKPIVGTALMQLVERGSVDLNVAIQEYVPEFPKKRWPITVRHLLTHTSGIRHYRGTEFLSRVHYDDLVEPLKIFADDDLLFEPGSRFSYSTYGFNVVANIVENCSGMPIAKYMQKHVYGPAWMSSTALEDQTAVQPGRAKWYGTDSTGAWTNQPYVDLSNKYAGGGITSTVEDLARFHIAYSRGVLLEAATISQMYQPHRFADGKLNKFGLAWRIEEVEVPGVGKLRKVGHSGGSVGANTLFERFPERGFAIAVVANHAGKLREIVSVILRAFAQAGALRAD